MKIKQNIIQIGHIFQIIHKTNALLTLINDQPDIDKRPISICKRPI